MAYLGNSNLVQNFTPAVDYFNGNASTTSFTLSRTVGSVFDIQAFIENVPQNPSSAFTVAGNVITFTSAPPSGTNNIYVRYTSPVVQQVKPAPGTVGPTELNSAYSLWNLSGATINYTAGNVGIGTIPSYGLDVRSTEAPAIRISRSGSAGQIASMVFEDGTSTLGSGNTTRVASDSGAMSFSTGGPSGAITGGTERMRITSDGKIGIGTSSPDPALEIRSASRTSDSTRYNITAIDSSSYAQGVGGGINFGFIWNSNGDPMGRAANIKGIKENGNNNDYASALVFSTTQNSASTTEHMRIASDGSILLGTSTQGGATGISFSNASDSAAYGKSMYMNSPYNGTRNAISFAYNSSGVGAIVTGTSSTSYNTSSDYRLKENITPMTGALTKVAQLKPVTYKWKLDGKNGQGFIAHELQAVVPDCVTGEKDAVDADDKPVYQGVDTSFLVATLTAAIQEQQAIIEELKTRIEILEAK